MKEAMVAVEEVVHILVTFLAIQEWLAAPTLVAVVVGRPSGPGAKSLLATAMPALKADSTAAMAIDCHSTMAARGASIII